MNSSAQRGWVAGLRHVLRWVLVVAALILAYLLFYPVPLHPYAWMPPSNPGTMGPRFKPTEDLSKAVTLAETLVETRFASAGKPENFGPEDVAISPCDRQLYTGLGDGSIVRVDPESGDASIYANTGGRPLGVSFDASGDNLYVADARRGLVVLDLKAAVPKPTILANTVDGEPVRFADNLDVASDGKVYFSAPTRTHTLEQITLDVFESRPTGRLLRYDPATGIADTLLDNLFYANGVAVSQDGTFVLVAEFLAFRISRYWISGPNAGSHDVFIDGLPGYPDNITTTPDGTFLVGLSLERIALLDKLRPMPWAVKVLYRLQPVLGQKPRYPGYVLELTTYATVKRFIASEAHNAQVTGATVLRSKGGKDTDIFMGSLVQHAVRRLRLAPAG